MKRIVFRAAPAAAVMLFFILFSGFMNRGKIALEGAWQVAEIRTVQKDGSVTTAIPKESQVLFAGHFYSFCWTTHQSTTHSWQMNDSTKLSRFNQSLINAGTYELKGDLLTMHADYAQNPMFVNGTATYRCAMSGDTLVLTGISVNAADQTPNPVYANGAFIVTKMVRKR
jgi:hypothetical protein